MKYIILGIGETLMAIPAGFLFLVIILSLLFAAWEEESKVEFWFIFIFFIGCILSVIGILLK